MTPEEVTGLWGRAIEQLQGEAGVRLMTEIGENAKAHIETRIIQKGESDTGVTFATIRPYRKDYEEYKKKEGKYKGYVDFQFTGLMWKNVQILLGSTTTNEVKIGAMSAENKEKLNKNARKWGSILNLSDNEANQAKAQYIDGVIDIFKQVGL